MRERYEREEDYPERRSGAGHRRRDEMPRGRSDEHVEDRADRGYRSDADRWDERGRLGWGEEQGDDWGDVQIGRWAGDRRRPDLRDEPGRRMPDESYWSGTTGRWGRDLDREPRGYGGERRPWRYGPPDSDRDWQPERGAPGGRSAGRFGGIGPKGYQRSDDRIREDVCDRLTADAYVDPSDVVVRVKDGEVTLEGSIDGRDAKRRIEDTVDDVAGVRQVHNFLQVRPRGGQAGMADSGSAGGRQT
jgi:hypothetical protein